jgi:hypothetical protein
MRWSRYALCISTWLWGYFANAVDLTDQAARQITETFINGTLLGMPIGTFLAQGEVNDWQNGRVSVGTYHTLTAAQHMDLVHIQKRPRITGPLGVPVTPPHIYSEQFVSSLTEKGRALNKFKAGAEWRAQYEVFAVKQVDAMVRQIVRNQEIKRGVDEYRLIFLRYNAAWNEEFVALMSERQKVVNLANGICAHCGEQVIYASKRKGRVLLKRDDFSDSWKVIAIDSANEDEEFKTDSVNATVQSLGSN